MQPSSSYLTKPIKIIASFSPGGSSDVIGRSFAEVLSVPLGQSIPRQTTNGEVALSHGKSDVSSSQVTIIVTSRTID